MDDMFVNYFDGLEFGELQQFGVMGILPVFKRKSGNNGYLSLKEAMIQDLLKITELNDSGAVPQLKVMNNSELPVLILDGEELMGAKQNRIVNTSILLREKFETIIPVSCVEQGRWSYTSKNFQDSDRIANSYLRNVKSTSVKQSVESTGEYLSDQGAVWDEIHKLQDKMEVNSPTSALGDVYDAKSIDLQEFVKAFKLMEGQKGLLVFVDGEIIGLDVVSNESAYKDLHEKLIKSYALDSMVQDKNIKFNINIDMVHEFIKEILKSDESKNESVGYGLDYRFASKLYTGSSLVYKNEVIHVSFFKSIGDYDIREMNRHITRANLRQY
ncbi:MAG: DUF6569 family protein [Methanobacterium sp.]|uniref:ARPP-1 family domain-containing protein n=1 Tax=Methanobacterium sp. TaxID=2164 RepID=UPI003C71CDB0